MYQTQPFKLGPNSTPTLIKWTIIATGFVSFFSLVFRALFTQVFGLPSPQYLLSLTVWGIHKFFLWQFVSYFFVQPITQEGASFSLVLQIFFTIYLLWTMGSSIVQIKGNKHFLGLYFCGGCFVGLIAYVMLNLLHSSLPFAGATPCIYMLLIGWIFLFPNAQLALFFLFPIRAKWLIFGLFGMHLFLDFSNGNFFTFFVITSAIIYAYLYAIFVWEMLGPFYHLHGMEKNLIYLKRKMVNTFCKFFFRKRAALPTSKLCTIKTRKFIMMDLWVRILKKLKK